MRITALGRLAVADDQGEPCAIGSLRQRQLLAVLLCRPGRSASNEALLDALWGDRLPASAWQNLRTYVHRLRRTIGADRIRYAAPAYTLRLAPGELDVDEFERLAAAGRRARDTGDAATAAERLGAALARWRGAPYGGLDTDGDPPEPVRAEIDRLTELRLAVLEDRVSADLALGRHRDLVGELLALVTAHPLRERPRGQLMLALYRSGRAPDALEVYRSGREQLVEELGMEPGAHLRELATAVLTDDGSLHLPEQRHVAAPPVAPTPAAPAPVVPAPVVPALAGPPVPTELPAANRLFTGRRGEVDRMVGWLTATGDAAPRAILVSGPGGAGKSALALSVAGRTAAAFPDGQLYADLRGATTGAEPLPPIRVLARFLRSLGVAAESIPCDPDEAAARFRSETAGRSVVVVLDDAADAGQVRPLLPGGGCSAVVVTSRRRLAVDGAHQLDLGLLPVGDAVDLLGALLGPDRVAAEPAAAAEIVALCGRLPLALRIAGARLAGRPDWSLAAFVRRLADARTRLDELVHDDLAVRASLRLSYAELDADAARLFDALGCLDLPWVGADVVAALVDEPEPRVRRVLDVLVAGQLVQARYDDEAGRDRYGLHDLVRLYAIEQAADTGSLHRVREHYLAGARAALRAARPRLSRRLQVGPPVQRAGPEFAASVDAVRWLRSELVNLAALAARSADGPDPAPGFVVGLGAALAPMLREQALWAVADTLSEQALRCARAVRAPSWVANAAADRGALYAVTRHFADRFEDGVELLEQAAEYYRAAGEHEAEAGVLGLLGDGHLQRRLAPAGIAYYERAHRRYVAMDDLANQAVVAHNIAIAHFDQGRYDQAIEVFQRSLELFEATGDRAAQSMATLNIGEAHARAGRPEPATDYLTRSIRLNRAVGRRRSEAEGLKELGDALYRLGRYDEAARRWRDYLDLLVEIGTIGPAEVDRILAHSPPALPTPP
jgi:DNA-binding SARP family transcriptional activator/tetratricopeptide (TPR) repeat protein